MMNGEWRMGTGDARCRARRVRPSLCILHSSFCITSLRLRPVVNVDAAAFVAVGAEGVEVVAVDVHLAREAVVVGVAPRVVGDAALDVRALPRLDRGGGLDEGGEAFLGGGVAA